MKEFYRQKLPHYTPTHATFFVTYRLAGSIPMHIIQEAQLEFQSGVTKLQHRKISGDEGRYAKGIISKKYFKKIDDFLDNSMNGPYWLQEPLVASAVADSLHFLSKDEIDLWCFSIMPNHVHAVLDLKNNEEDLFHLLQRHKSFTAKQANRILQRTGQFWEAENYDHVVRKGEFDGAISYTINNPVKAGFVNRWEDWKWTYLNPLLR